MLTQSTNSFFASVFKFLKKQPWHFWAAVLLTLAGLAIRLYNLPNTVMFLGDQGRDALIVSRIFKHRDLVFIGPVTSVGNMYLGPLYYYFMVPFLWLSYPSPLGPVYAVAVLSTAAIFLLYWFGKKMFNARVGVLAALFLCFSTAAVTISRFSWNPNLAPLAALLMIFFNWKALRKPRYWIGVAACFSILIQLHYLTLLTGISAGIVWLTQLIKLLRNQQGFKNHQVHKLLKPTVIGLLILLASLTPLILFDIKHNGLNLKAFLALLTEEESFVRTNFTLLEQLTHSLGETEGRAMHILAEYNFGQLRRLNRLITFTLLGILGWSWMNSRKQSRAKQNSHLVLIVYLLVGIFGTAAYQHNIFNHYIAYLFPVTALVYALTIDQLIKKSWLGLIPTVGFITWFLWFNLPKLPLESNYQYQIKKKTAQAISQHLSPEQSYNLVLLSKSKDLYGQSYRYFLSTTSIPPLPAGTHLDPEVLVIIDEQKNPKGALNNQIYEIIKFGDDSIDKSIEIEQGPNVYFLEG